MKLPEVRRRLACGVVAASALHLFGCGDGTQPEEREIIYFSALETDVASPTPLEDPGPALRADQRLLYDPIIDGFLKNHRELLRRDDIGEQLERIENIFVISGRYLDLVTIYQQDVEARGVQSPVAERLAWAYVRLGQEAQAAALLEKLKAAKPESPTVHFLIGALALEKGMDDQEAMRQLVEAWSRVVELEPDFVGYEGITAERIRAQIETIRAQLPAEAAVTAPAGETAGAPEAVAEAPEAVVEAPEAVVETPEAVAEAPVEAVEAPAQPAPQQQYRLLVARGELALSQGAAAQAAGFFAQAKALEPQGFAALFGEVRAGWADEAARNPLARQVRALAEREDLSARQAYDLGLFAFSKMSDNETAASLWERVQQKDPQLAERLGVAGLLEKVR